MNRSERYRRQCSIPELGEVAQGHWNNAHVAIVGVGGLGCGVATALATAGVGKLTLIDGDVVSLSNLHRQWLFDGSHIGQSKVLAAQCSLEKFQPEIEIDAIQGWLTKEHLDKLKNDGVNVIVDACDQVEAKLFIDASLDGSSIPWVFGAAEQWEGRVTTLNCPDENGNKWRLTDFYDDKVKGFMLGSCQERGILGPVVQTVAMIQSIEVLRILAQLPPNYAGKMLIWDASQGTFLSPSLKTNKR
jgi:molybdopterin/thiamine biosynthesis adenylyltransferase